MKLGSEFMPPIDEGALFYMPTTMPGISITEAQRLLQVTDRIIKQFPEVDRVLGKAGRAETSTDPAPLSMLETVITLKPKSEWRKTDVWYSSWAPELLKSVFRRITSDCRPWPAGGRLCACQGCGSVQKLVDDAWNREAAFFPPTQEVP